MSEKILGMSKVHGTNKVTLVEEVAKNLGVKVGDKVLFILGEDGEIILRKA
jgi:bifunctional DNA-binding transcriptional regulator/antitoxin component of YhaV-PrlF toxin-antitoxin module